MEKGKPKSLTVMNKETVIASLKRCSSSRGNCSGCAYHLTKYKCRVNDLMRDALTLLERDNITTSRGETVIASLRKCANGVYSCDGCAYALTKHECRVNDLMRDAVTLLERDN